jgi:transposase-like protein
MMGLENPCVSRVWSVPSSKVKQRVYPMLGFKRFGNAAVTISGIELAQKIKKGQFDTSELKLERARVRELWQGVLAA